MKQFIDSPVKSGTVEHFESLADGPWDRVYEERNSFRARRAAVKALLHSTPAGTVLDLGCGTGQYMQLFAQRGDTYFGVDASVGMIAEAKKRAEALRSRGFDAKVEIRDAEDLPFPDEFFHTLIAVGLVEYFKPYDPLMREIQRVIKPGGTVIITVPKKWSVDRIIHRALSIPRMLLRPVYHRLTGRRPERVYRKLWTRSELERVCRTYGIEPTGGLHYGVKLIGFPFDRVAPRSTSHFNSHFERFSQGVGRAFANGYIVRCTKVSQAQK